MAEHCARGGLRIGHRGGSYLVAPVRLGIVAWGLAFVALLVWWSSIRPSNDGDWQADVARLPRVEIRGEQLIVHNIRNFDYRTESDFTPRYVDRTYDLSTLRGVDLFMSYWGSPAIAHTIMSWQFDNAPPLAISIETRKRKGQEYSAAQGFLQAVRDHLCRGRRARRGGAAH